MESAKACWEVTAGILPGQPMPEYTRQFWYTSQQGEQDLLVPEGQPNMFTTLVTQAHQYALTLTQPRYVNWVRVDWIWF